MKVKTLLLTMLLKIKSACDRLKTSRLNKII